MTRLPILLAPAVALGLAGPAAADDADRVAATFLDTTAVHKAELRLSADDWKAMQPAGGGPPPFGPPASGPNGFKFSYEFPYVRGTVTIGDETVADVGVRFKGNGTYLMSAQGLKRPLRLDFNRFTPGGRFRGLKALALANNAMDATRVREAAAYAVYRAAGVPAPRTTFVELSLHVPGRYEHRLLGLYTAVEPIDKAFLARRFGAGGGMLLKPEKLPTGIVYLGDDWAPYAERYGPKDEPTDAEKRRLVAFARLVDRADDAAFRREVRDYLDVDGFLRFLAATSFLAHYDSFIGLGHNYVMYLDPRTNRFSFLPWDVDHAFGAFFPFGTPAQLADASVNHPHAGANKLVDRLMADPDVRASYRAAYRWLAATAFDPDRVSRVVADCEAAVREPVARELRSNPPVGFGPPPGFGGGTAPREFVAARARSVAAQLSGERPGYVPRPFGFGPPR